MPRQPAPLPSVLGDVFTRTDALAAGVTPGRLRAKDLESPFHGVRQRSEPKTKAGAQTQKESDPGQNAESPDSAGQPTDAEKPLARDRAARKAVLRLARAYREVMPEHAFFAGRTAAVIYGCTVAHGTDLEVGVQAPSRAPRGRGIRGIKVSPALVNVREHEGLRVSSAASTWAMLGRELSMRELVVVGDAIVKIPRDHRGRLQPKQQLATIEKLRRAAEAGPRRGVATLRAALAHIRVGSSSPLETEYRLDAAAAGLPEPQLDMEIRDAGGSLCGITEVVYPEYRTLVEIEGDHHRTDQRQWDRDIEKYAAYVAEGWEVVRLTSRHIRGPHPRAVAMVRDVLTRRGWRPEAS